MLLIPSYLVYVRTVRPIIAFYNWCANAILRALRRGAPRTNSTSPSRPSSLAR